MSDAGAVAGDLVAALAEHRRCARRAWLARRGWERAVESPPPSWDLNPAVAAQWPHAFSVAADAPDAAAQTLRKLDAGEAVLGGVFERDGWWVRADLVDGQHLIGVTAATRPRRIWDLAVKCWLIGQAGRTVSKVSLACIDSAFVYRGDLNGVFIEHDVTQRVRALSDRVPKWLRAMQRDLADEQPDRSPTQCRRPFACGFLPYCEPAEAHYPVTALRSAPGLVRTLQEAGYDDLREVPAKRLQKPLHQRIRRAAISGRVETDDAVVAFARELPYPRTFLDFEAVQFALPRWRGTRPYQALPFQWVAVSESRAGVFRIDDFLDVSGEPPMRECAHRLLEAVPASGPIVVYGSFEREMLTMLARLEPALADALAGLRERLVDLLPWLQKHFYHRDMQGAWSLKAILAALNLERETTLQDGLAAQRAYLEAIEPNTAACRRAELAEQLRAYCAADAEGMRRVLRVIADQPLAA